MLLAVDPGMNSPGIAIFREGFNQLVAASRVAIPSSFAEMPLGARWMHVALEIVTAVNREIALSSIRQVVFEKPQIYQRERGKTKGDPNQIVSVAGVAANVTGILLGGHCRPEVISPTPAEWIGQCPKVCPVCEGKKTAPAGPIQAMMNNRKRKAPKRVKAICPACNSSAWGTPRGRRIRSRLSEAEQALVPDQNDAIDAVGIGLWALGRLEKISVFSNGHDGR